MSLATGAVRLRGVSRRYKLMVERNLTLKETLLRRSRTTTRDIWALRDVDLDVPPGTALGVVGANGAGKSTLLKVLADIIPPDRGTVEVGGKVVSLLELGAGFHPDFTGRENVVLNASIHGMSRREVQRRMDAIVAFAELERFIDSAVRTYSSGMYMRLGFAVAAELEPDVLLLDEILAVGDESFQQKCISRIADFQRRGATIIFVSHSQWAIQTVCERAIWLSGGRVMDDGRPDDVLELYHRGLTAAGAVDEGEIENADWHSARVRAVRVTDRSQPADRFMSGEGFAIEVDYEVVEPVAPVVGVTITTVDGALIAGTDNRTAMEPEGAPPGRRTARFELDSLPLQEGRFAVTVDLVSASGLRFHHLERCAEFTVFASGRGFGPVAIPGEWQVALESPLTAEATPS